MKKRIFSLLLILVVIILVSPEAHAANEVDMNKLGSITLELYYDGKPIKDGSFVCIQVADVIEKDGNYYFRQVMEKTIYKNLPTAAEMYQLVMDNKTFFKTDNYSVSHTNDSGYVTFSGRKPGLYLIIQDDGFKDFSKMNPFLVSLPYMDIDGVYKYDVDATIKSELRKDYTIPTSPTTSTKPGSSSGEKLPQTGQLTWPIPWLASSGMLVFAFGWWLFSSHRKESYET